MTVTVTQAAPQAQGDVGGEGDEGDVGGGGAQGFYVEKSSDLIKLIPDCEIGTMNEPNNGSRWSSCERTYPDGKVVSFMSATDHDPSATSWGFFTHGCFAIDGPDREWNVYAEPGDTGEDHVDETRTFMKELAVRVGGAFRERDCT